MKITAIGGSGFVGKHFIKACSMLGHEILVLDVQDPEKTLEGNVQFEKCDVFNSNQLLDILKSEKPQSVVSFIGLPDAGQCNANPSWGFQLNVQSVEKVWDAINKVDTIEQGILLSTAAVYGNTNTLPVSENSTISPTSIYGWQKATAEKIVEGYSSIYGPHSTVVRLFNAYGRGQAGIMAHLISAAHQGKSFNLYGGEQIRDFVYIGDVANALVKLCESPPPANRILNVGSGKGTSIQEIAGHIGELCGELNVTKLDQDTSSYYDSVADIKKIKSEIDWNPHNTSDFMKKILLEEMVS